MSPWELKAREIAAGLGTKLGHCTDLMPDEWRRFLLVEANVSTPAPPFWFSAHHTREDAAAAWLDQTQRAAWAPFLLIDLTTGERFEPHLALTWKAMEEAVAA